MVGQQSRWLKSKHATHTIKRSVQFSTADGIFEAFVADIMNGTYECPKNVRISTFLIFSSSATGTKEPGDECCTDDGCHCRVTSLCINNMFCPGTGIL